MLSCSVQCDLTLFKSNPTSYQSDILHSSIYFIFQLESGHKVEESDTINPKGKYKTMQFLNKWTLDYVQEEPKHVKVSNRFTMSKSGAIGTSCYEKASLAVMYPDTDKPAVILSEDEVYRSATKDGCLYLWDVKSKNQRKCLTQSCQWNNIGNT